MRFIDTHMHLSDEAYRGEEEAVLERALNSNVYKMMMADIDSMGERKRGCTPSEFRELYRKTRIII